MNFDSEFDYYYDSNDDDDNHDGDEDEERYTLGEDNQSSFLLPRDKNYTVLTENDIQLRQNHEISHVSSVLSISEAEATTLLCHYKWNVSKLHDKWFAGEDTVRANAGLFSGPATSCYSDSRRQSQCQICFDDDLPLGEILTANCDHPYCLTCWRTYVITSITDSGPGCLSLRCPDPACPAAVGLDLIKRLSLGGDYEKRYEGYLVRSYVEGKKETIKWCPAPGCENAVEFELGGVDVYDVTCLCSNAFCWNCSEEAHRPVDCKTVAQWMKKNSSESENTNWILAFSKPCPMCKRPIEKNQGCSHMTCGAPCRYEFCWLCLEDWRSHGSCNRFQGRKQDGNCENEDERRREMAKKSIQRYTHYYERWASNHKSRQRAIEDLNKMKTTYLKLLSDKLKEPETQLSFILEAWQQIVECRRVLKWTYAYGYYLDEKEHAKRQLFEYSQGEAEAGLERLHHCAERELSENFIFIAEDEPQADFNQFRSKLAGLTKVTRSYFENLVQALENGLSEVKPQAPKKPKGHKRKAAGSSSTSGQSNNVAVTVDLDDIGYWSCDCCTYLNPESALACQMCHGDN